MSDLPQRYRKLSKYISYVLRHHPEDAGLELDERGFISVESLLEAISKTKHSWASREDIETLIKKGDKQRFEIVDDKIRALYGHSIDVEIEKKSSPPEVLYHGTSPESVESIFEEGLKPMGRQYVHLSKAKQDALQVGRRHHHDPVLLKILAGKAWEDGTEFYERGNLYLSGQIEPEYIELGNK